MQRTLALLKPDLLRRPDAVHVRATILADAERAGLRVVASCALPAWPAPTVRAFYAEHAGRFFYSRLVFAMSSGPVEALVLQGADAVRVWRELVGPTHLPSARSQPATVRGRWSCSDTRNVVHGSDSTESAAREIALWFPDLPCMDANEA